MISKILRCISQEDVLRILNLINYKRPISEDELNETLNIPSFEIHKHIKELVNMEVIIDREVEGKEVYFFNSAFVKKFKFFEILMNELENENLYALDLRGFGKTAAE
ncbi:helix-turn-helix domain-containing protein [Sebaldella sp. S0638]|uniref:helix-turn-helix domain-containing protein n=1 Tax=Sebaldella sp. S0638 TaxID=2957809 RepID=UPI00209E20B8|nr:helix-turn-helix domain-containing protein [Sebaldella sp. S0638]MCP1223247.1 helix-turn-helix domain-containing protein [Sebaldella sp. S0638]